MENEKQKIQCHVKFMANITLEMLRGNKNVLDVNGDKNCFVSVDSQYNT